MLFFFVLFLAPALISAITIPGTCDSTVKVVENFALPLYNGTWYELYRYEQAFQISMECVTATYILNGTSVIVHNQGIINNKHYELKGVAISATSNGDAKLIVNFPSNTTTSSNYWVLGTDYVHYAVVYSCRQVGPNMTISSWILSREPYANMIDFSNVVKTIEREQIKTKLEWTSYRHTIHGGDTCNSASATIFSSFALAAAFIVTRLLN